MMSPVAPEDVVAEQLARATITAASGGAVRGRRVFPLSASIISVSLQAQLQGVLESFETRLYGLQNQPFQWLHQRSELSGNISEIHAVWKAQLEQHKQETSYQLEIVDGLVRIVASTCLRPKAFSLALSCLMRIELAAALQLQKGAFSVLLDEPYYLVALEEYRTQMQACVAATDLDHVFTWFHAKESMREDITAHEVSLSPYVRVEVGELYRDVLKCIIQTASLRNVEQEKIEPLVRFVETGVESEVPSASLAYVDGASAVKTPYENYFLNGSWGATLPGYGYGSIGRLPAISQALYKLESSLQERVKLACQEDSVNWLDAFKALVKELEGDKALCHGIGSLIESERSSLPQAQATINYVAALLAQVRAILAAIDVLQNMCKEAFIPLAAARDRVVTILGDDVIEKSVVDISHLYEVTQAVVALDAFPAATKSRVYTVLGQAIALEGHSIVKASAIEMIYASRVFTREIRMDLAGDILISYLMRGFLSFLHFPRRDAVDCEFQAVLFMLKYDPANKVAFERALNQNPNFKALHDAYMAASGFEAEYQVCTLVNQALLVLHEADVCSDEFGGMYNAYVRHASVKELVSKMSVFCETNPSAALRQAWLLQKLELVHKTHPHISRAIKEHVRSHSDRVLLKPLRLSLFGSDNKLLRSSADQLIVAYIQSPEFTKFPPSDFVKTLLNRWRLRARDRRLLVDFFQGYTSSEKEANFWRNQFGVGRMEVFLYDFMQGLLASETWAHGVRPDSWYKVMPHYREFRVLLKEHGQLDRGSDAHKAAQALYGAAKSAIANIQESEPSLAAQLVSEMKGFVSLQKFSFDKELALF